MGVPRRCCPYSLVHWRRRMAPCLYTFIIAFYHETAFDRGNRRQGLGYSFEVEFAEEVVGPLCLGYGCYFGLGLFIPG